MVRWRMMHRRDLETRIRSEGIEEVTQVALKVAGEGGGGILVMGLGVRVQTQRIT